MRASRRVWASARDKFNSIMENIPPSATCRSVAEPIPANLPLGPLSGTTFGVKLNIASTAAPVDCASEMLRDYVSPFSSTAVLLVEQAGLVSRGTTNMDEFGMGSATTLSSHGAAVNPRYWPEVRVTGGSSGGSAAAVAAGYVDFALGTDTGGSVRQPAVWCGVVGFKPSYGRISRHGVVAYAQLLDTVGVVARLVQMVQKVFRVLDVEDRGDVTSVPEAMRRRGVRGEMTEVTEQNELTQKSSENINPSHSISHPPSQEPLRWVVGVPEQMLLGEVSAEAVLALEHVLAGLQQRGCTIVPVSVPAVAHLLLAYYTLATAEAASDLARYDGVRYGAEEGAAPVSGATEPQSDARRRAAARSRALGPEVQRRVLLGNYTLSSALGSHYLRATGVRRRLVDEFNHVFARPHGLGAGDNGDPDLVRCDVLLSPAVLGRAPLAADYQRDVAQNFLEGYASDALTVPASMAGLPTVSVPCGHVGVQVMAQFGDDTTALAVAQEVEKIAHDFLEL